MNRLIDHHISENFMEQADARFKQYFAFSFLVVLRPSVTHSFFRSYKELMNQCNVLGRSESRTQQKLEKAKELLKKLKVSSASYNLAFKLDSPVHANDLYKC
jgi:hypothetical protein